jgi:hypothetical protein
VAGFQFREEFFLLQIKGDLSLAPRIALIYFETPEDAAQRLQRFLHWEVRFEETFHCRFAVLALNGHGLRHRPNNIGFLQVGESHL